MNAALSYKQTIMSELVGHAMDPILKEVMESANQELPTLTRITTIFSHGFAKSAISMSV